MCLSLGWFCLVSFHYTKWYHEYDCKLNPLSPPGERLNLGMVLKCPSHYASSYRQQVFIWKRPSGTNWWWSNRGLDIGFWAQRSGYREIRKTSQQTPEKNCYIRQWYPASHWQSFCFSINWPREQSSKAHLFYIGVIQDLKGKLDLSKILQWAGGQSNWTQGSQLLKIWLPKGLLYNCVTLLSTKSPK